MGAIGRLRHLRGSALRQMRFRGRAGLMGDPGFFSKLKKLSLKKIIKGATGVLAGPLASIIPGAGLVKDVASAAGLLPKIGGSQYPLFVPTPGGMPISIPATLPGGAQIPGLAPRGSRGVTHTRWDPKQQAYVPARRRRMNILNPKALRRSMRRVEGFAHFAKRTISFTHKVHMKKKGRRR